MFDRVSDITGGSDGDADAGELADLLHDEEELVHALANSDGLEHTESGRTTTVEPNRGAQVFMLVTDERVLYVFGDQPDEPEIEIELTDYKAAHHRKGLLSSKVQVKTDGESVLFGPDEGDTEAAADYVERVGACWADMSTALARARAAVAQFEDRCEEGKATGDKYLDAKSNLSEARRAASRDNDAPTLKMRHRIEDARAELAGRRVDAWLDRADEQITTVEEALAAGDHERACEAYVAGADALSSARDAVEEANDVEADTALATERLSNLEDALEGAGEGFLSESSARCEQALDADEPAVAVEAWEEAFDRYSAAVDAGWNGQAPVSGEALELQLTWVTASLLDALGSHATMLEERADDTDDTDEAVEYYEDAAEWFERAQQYADDHPEHSPAEFAEAAERVEDKKIDASGWEFGNA
jgi:hypothetical protein